MLVIGSRGSQLALWQANHIKARFEARGVETRIEVIRTTGDKITDSPLHKMGGKGLFTKEIEDALLDGRIDLAVHSLKDLPTELPKGLTIAAIPEREDQRDAIVGGKLRALKFGARVGTSSLRRIAQLRRIRPDLDLQSIRGNVDTRIGKVEKGEYDAIVLAAAGLRRLGWDNIISETFRPDIICSLRWGQGALYRNRNPRIRAWNGSLRAAGRSVDAVARNSGAHNVARAWRWLPDACGRVRHA